MFITGLTRGAILNIVTSALIDFSSPPAPSVNVFLLLPDVWFLTVTTSSFFNSSNVLNDNWPAPLFVPWVVESTGTLFTHIVYWAADAVVAKKNTLYTPSSVTLICSGDNGFHTKPFTLIEVSYLTSLSVRTSWPVVV